MRSIISLFAASLFAACVLTLAACNLVAPPLKGSDGKENFEAFYQKFSTDSTFQVSRVLFPLQGLPPIGERSDSVKEYYYTLDKWKMHHLVDPNNHTISRHVEGDDSFKTEYVSMPYGYYIERRFLRSGGSWMLVYYSGIQQLQKEER